MRPDGTLSGILEPTRRQRLTWSLAVSLIAVGAAIPADAVAQATMFQFTGAEQTYTVPDGVASVRITAVGGAGGTRCQAPDTSRLTKC